MAPSTDQGFVYPATTDLRQIARDFKRLADSINVPVSILMESLIGEGVVDATDPVVAALLGSGAGTNLALDSAVAGHVASGESATRGALDLAYVSRHMSWFQNVVVGEGAMAATTDLKARNNNAFGIGALAHAERARYNDAFGLNALYYLNSGLGEPDNTTKATRNSAFGSNTQRHNRTGRNNVSMGRNTLQNNETGDHNVAIGAAAMTTTAPMGLNGEIQNQVPQNVSGNVAVGTEALAHVQSNENVGVGYRAAYQLSNGAQNVAVGRNALASLDSNLGPDGRIMVSVGWTVSYTISGGTLTVTQSSHGLETGFLVAITFPNTSQQYLKVASATTNSFTLATDLSGVAPGSGSAAIAWYTTNELGQNNEANVALGPSALFALRGRPAGEGAASLANTALGRNAGRWMQDGSDCTDVWGSTMLGQSSRVSGSQQVQLGHDAVTVYSTQPIQVRSDARDKTDIRDTELGLDFISKLRPVDYRWDMRSDYFVYDDDGNITAVNEPDGTKKRTRFHHGFIAQEVKQVMDDLGVDFGGYQDHKVNGGNDVLSMGYEELIGPLVRAVQELAARVAELEGEAV